MPSRKSTGAKSKSKGPQASRAAAKPPMPPQALRVPGAPTTPVPPPPGAVGADPVTQAAAKTLDTRPKGAQDRADTGLPQDALELKKQELIALVVERSDVAKKHAKPVIEAMLAVLGEALAEGRELNLQPLGKVKHNRIKDTPRARVIVTKIRQPKLGSTPGKGGDAGDASGPKEPVADAAE